MEKQQTNYNTEEMSCEEITTVRDQYNENKTHNIKEFEECEETKEVHDILVCEYKRLEGYMID